MEHLAEVRAWQQAWRDWDGPGDVRWETRQWRSLGVQSVPVGVSLGSPESVADWIGEGAVWRVARHRLQAVTRRWPVLSHAASSSFPVLAEWSEEDFKRLLDLMEWFEQHGRADRYVRQLPVPGLDSKWLESRRTVVEGWLRALRYGEADGDLYELTGLRRLPVTLRMRLLDSDLRARLGGLGDITAPVEELTGLDLPVRSVFIVENLQTGLAFHDLQGAVVFMRQGYAVEPFAEIPWLSGCACYYWGDLDTHGFAILDRLRNRVPHVRSVLMDEETLLTHRSLWGEEAQPVTVDRLPRLTEEEQNLYEKLCRHHWGLRVRLEQERIAWDFAWSRICAAMADRGLAKGTRAANERSQS